MPFLFTQTLRYFFLSIGNVTNKNPLNIVKRTPLHYASINGHLEVCRLLIQKEDHADSWGKTPKALAEDRYQMEIFQLFESYEKKNEIEVQGFLS